jgi:hypothetical protein
MRASNSGLTQAPIYERRTPRRLVVVTVDVGVRVVLRDPGITLPHWILRRSNLAFGDNHP